MRYAIILSGEISDYGEIGRCLDTADRILCADGGARHLKIIGKLPDLLIGDFDSITEEDMQWLSEAGVPKVEFPREKDATDSQLALEYACSRLEPPAGQHQIIVLGALGSRPDHVLANQLLAAHYAGLGWNIIMSDGSSWIYAMHGRQSLELELPDRQFQKIAVSLIPVTDLAEGVCCQGLKYTLENNDIARGSTLGISNQVAGGDTPGNSQAVPVKISLQKGTMLVIVTPEK